MSASRRSHGAAAWLPLLALTVLASILLGSPAEAADRPAPSASMCDHSYSGLAPHNSLEDIRAGYYTGPPFQRYRVAVDGDAFRCVPVIWDY